MAVKATLEQRERDNIETIQRLKEELSSIQTSL